MKADRLQERKEVDKYMALGINGTESISAGCGCPECRGRQMGMVDPRYLDEQMYRMRKELEYVARREISMQLTSRILLSSEPKRTMNGLSTIAKKLLDSDTRAFVKAGILDESLEITSKGTMFLLAHYLSDNKAKLAKEARKEMREKKNAENEDCE